MVAAVIAAAVVGLAQAFVLRSALARPAAWFGAMVVGWPIGVALARGFLPTPGEALSAFTDAVVVALIAGAVVGAAQAFVLRPSYS